MARLLVAEANATGGGQAKAKPLKDFEARAVQLFNPIATTGNPELLVEAGIDETFQVASEFLVDAAVDNTIYEVADDSFVAG